jgi:hypothetical protein
MPMLTGTEAFVAGLTQLGYRPEVIAGHPDHVVIDYEVESGRYFGARIRLGFIVPPDFPVTPPSGLHVSPHIHALKSDGQHPSGAVHASPFSQYTAEAWQYWSRPCPGWGAGKRTVAAYLSHIWRLWDSQ